MGKTLFSKQSPRVKISLINKLLKSKRKQKKKTNQLSLTGELFRETQYTKFSREPRNVPRCTNAKVTATSRTKGCTRHWCATTVKIYTQLTTCFFFLFLCKSNTDGYYYHYCYYDCKCKGIYWINIQLISALSCQIVCVYSQNEFNDIKRR